MADTLSKRLAIIEKKIEKASAARMALPFGSSRARVTTANARLNALLEARQRLWDEQEKVNG
jgi:hypothetical protein